eukprot:1577441-Prymnesium_polylepis.1
MARARRREPGGRGSSRTCIAKPRSQVLRRHSSNLHSTHPLLSPTLVVGTPVVPLLGRAW